jgi:transcription elongation GreA/GreB family factor
MGIREDMLESLFSEKIDIDNVIDIMKKQKEEVDLAVQSAAAEGDLRENSDYDTQLRQSEILSKKITEMQMKKLQYDEMQEIVTKYGKDKEFAAIGTVVYLDDLYMGIITPPLLLVTSLLGNEVDRLSIDSKIGSAIYGKPVGTIIRGHANSEKWRLSKIIGGSEE